MQIFIFKDPIDLAGWATAIGTSVLAWVTSQQARKSSKQHKKLLKAQSTENEKLINANNKNALNQLAEAKLRSDQISRKQNLLLGLADLDALHQATFEFPRLLLQQTYAQKDFLKSLEELNEAIENDTPLEIELKRSQYNYSLNQKKQAEREFISAAGLIAKTNFSSQRHIRISIDFSDENEKQIFNLFYTFLNNYFYRHLLGIENLSELFQNKEDEEKDFARLNQIITNIGNELNIIRDKLTRLINPDLP
jgi:hypothetical protein